MAIHRFRPHSILSVLRLGLGLGLLLPGVAAAQTVQELIDAAAPGDTVLVPSGEHARAFTVDKAITLLGSGPTPPRVVGLTGSQATVIGLAFDGSLSQKQGSLITAGSGLTVRSCTFSEAIRGVQLGPGASAVHFQDCRFEGLLEAISMDATAIGLTLDGCQVLDCTLGITSTSGFLCPPPGDRGPADRCLAGCRPITITATTFDGGDRHLELAGDYLLTIDGSEFRNPLTFALRLTGARLEMTGTDVVSSGGKGTGLDLRIVSGHITGSRILSWNEGIVAGDDGCTLFSDIVVGNDLAAANDIGNQLYNIRLNQPESIAAGANFWGTLNCSAVQAKLSGMEVSTITDAAHAALVPCGGVPVEPSTWGRLKTRYGPGTRP